MNNIKVFLIIVFITMSNYVFADVIVTKNGELITGFNIDIGTKFISYTEEEALSSPAHRIPVEDCYSVKIGDGPMQSIAEINGQVENSSENVPQESVAPTKRAQNSSGITVSESAIAENNEYIASFNTPYIMKEDAPLDPKKETNVLCGQWGVTKDSELATDDIVFNITLNMPVSNK